MKNLLTFILLFILLSNLSAEISVKSFRKLENDLDARVNAPIKDFSGDISAIIKVVTTQTGFTFDCGQAGIVKTVNKPSEIWVYVPYGVKRISIMHPQLGQLRDWIFSQPIEKATVYEMVLVSGRVETTVIEEIAKQWLVITPQPDKAMIYIDDVFVSKGEYQAQRVPGIFNYRVEAPLYHTEAGKLEITNEKKELKVNLKPAFGYLNISSNPENGATIILDGKELANTTPTITEALASGEHTVQIIKEMYQPTTLKALVIDGQTTPINFILTPNFAELNLTTSNNANIIINGQIKGKGKWSGRLSAGIYSVEAQQEKYHSAKQDIELKIGDNKVLTLQPTPIYGSINIITSPSGATITIDGKNYGTTPNTLNNILIGDCELQLSKVGYPAVNKNIVLSEGNNTELFVTLSNGRLVTVNSIPNSLTLFIDGNGVGKTPYKGMLSFGNHIIKIVQNVKNEEKTINVSQNGQDSIFNLDISVKQNSTLNKDKELADKYYSQNNFEQAAKLYEVYLKSGNSNVQDLIKYAMTLFMNQNLTKALEVVQMGLQKAPRNPVFNRLNMWINVDLKHDMDALKAADLFFYHTDNPDFTYLDYRYYGQALRNTSQTDSAIVQYKKGLSLDPTKVELWKDISDMFNEKKDYINAVIAYDSYLNSIRDDKKTAEVYLAMGKLYYLLGNDTTIILSERMAALHKADYMFIKVVALDPATNYRGNFYRARANSALDPDASQGLAKPYYYSTATLVESKADPRYNVVLTECYTYLGFYYLLKDDNVNSLLYWNKILNLDPNNGSAKKAKAGIEKFMKTKI